MMLTFLRKAYTTSRRKLGKWSWTREREHELLNACLRGLWNAAGVFLRRRRQVFLCGFYVRDYLRKALIGELQPSLIVIGCREIVSVRVTPMFFSWNVFHRDCDVRQTSKPVICWCTPKCGHMWRSAKHFNLIIRHFRKGSLAQPVSCFLWLLMLFCYYFVCQNYGIRWRHLLLFSIIAIICL